MGQPHKYEGASADPDSHYPNRDTGVAQPPAVGHVHMRKLGLRILTFAWLQGARSAVLLQELLGWPMETGCCLLRARNLISKEAAAK